MYDRMLKTSSFCVHAILIIGAIVLVTLHNIRSWHALPRNEPGKQRQFRTVVAVANESTTKPAFVFPAPPAPLACFVVTFKQPKNADPMQTIAYRNTARMYKALDGIMPLMALTGTSHVDSEAMWKEAGNEQIIREVQMNEYGTPFLRALVEQVERRCPVSTPFVAYANADIMFDSGLVKTLRTLRGWGQEKVLAVGRRRNHELKGELSMDEIHHVPSELFIDIAQDYFIMSRGLFGDWSTLPSYVIGRRAYDNALVDWAFHNANLVDATETITALHQTTGDGNYAGHAATNPDKEYNVNLPGAKYDHGAVGHAKYQTKACKAATPCVFEKEGGVIWPEDIEDDTKDMIVYRSARTGDVTTFGSLPDIVFVMFGNEAFMPMLMNFLCNTAAFPPMHQHTLMLVTSQAAVDQLVATKMEITVGLVNENSLGAMQAAFDYDTAEYVQLMLLRGKVLVSLLNRGKSIIWMEADAHYDSNLLDQPQITETKTDLVFFWDHLGWGGGFIRFAPTQGAKKFYVELVKRMQFSGQNDQAILNELISSNHAYARNHSEFDKCLFKSGAALRPDHEHHFSSVCAGVRPVVQQHNWIIGTHAKIDLAKSRGEWFLQEKDYSQCRQRDLRIVVMTMNRPKSLARLLKSLDAAEYTPDYPLVDLQVNVDVKQDQSDADKDTVELLNSFAWTHGRYEINIWGRHMGIYGQWVDSWASENYPSWLYRAVVLMEDDLEVSPFFAKWFIGAHEAYKSPSIGAVTGMRAQLVAKAGATKSVNELVPPNVHAFAYKLIATWSMSPTHGMWTQFRAWVKERKADPAFIPQVPDTRPSEWYMDFRAHGKEAGMWEMWFVRFASDFNFYTLYPWVENGASTVVSNWKEDGIHYSGDNRQDYPLMQTWQPSLLKQSPLPFVEWNFAFYVCLTGYLYGQFSNQLLTVSTANQYAKDRNKFLRLQSVATSEENVRFMTQNWDTLFDANAVPYMAIGDSMESCSEVQTYVDVYLNEFLPKRHTPGWFSVPELALNIQQQAIMVTASVHGRSMDGQCSAFPLLCPLNTEVPVPDMCSYNQAYVRKTFNVEDTVQLTLFTDGQNQQQDASYEIKDEHAFPVQLWSMVLSPSHYGNPRSSMDYLISLWKRQLRMEGTMQPFQCYGGEKQSIEQPPLLLHFVWVQPYLQARTGDAKEADVLALTRSWASKLASPMTLMVWTRDEIQAHFPDLVPLLERLSPASWISDIMRYRVLSEFGGLYLDTDEVPLTAPDALMEKLIPNAFTVCQTPWLHPSSATSEQLEQDTPCDSVAAGIIYAPPGHPAVECARQKSIGATESHLAQGNVNFDHHMVGPTMWTQCVKLHSGTIRVIPSWTFLPCPCCDNCNENEYKQYPSELVAGMHRWDRSWW